MRAKAKQQLELPTPPTWGGRRCGAGRKPGLGRPTMPHDRRPEHQARQPVQVTLRVVANAPSLRSSTVFPAVRRAISRSSKAAFRVIHFSAQQDHAHLIVEAESRAALRSGVQGLAIRIALAVNKLLGRRGRLWGDRYHARALETPREVRASMVYVLLNFRKHLRAPPAVDPRSSGAHFDGWARRLARASGASPVRPPSTWLGRFGWLRGGGPIDVREHPAGTARLFRCPSRETRRRRE